MKQNVCTVGIDLAKKIFHFVGTDPTGRDCAAQAAHAPCFDTLYGAAASGDHRHGGLWRSP